jgi:hypothetical protein
MPGHELDRSGSGERQVGLQGMKWGGMDWIYLAQDMDTWRALVNVVMNIRVP